MNQVSLKSLFTQLVFSSISVLRANTSGYPYVTLVGRHGSNNVYFGQKSADILTAKYQVGNNIAKELGSASVVETINAAGEKRYKLSLQGIANDYSSIGEMEDIFHTEQPGTLDVVAFVKDFSVAPVTETPADLNAPVKPILNMGTGTSGLPDENGGTPPQATKPETKAEKRARLLAEAEAEAEV